MLGERNYLLDKDGIARPINLTHTDSLIEYWKALAEQRRVKLDIIILKDENEVKISTVFLGVDHAFGDGPPMLFETMIFGLPTDETEGEYQDRCTTRDEALVMHDKAVEHAKKTLGII
jgi:hypothetical protein